ncbi:MAG: DUF4340 domain-containing protein, partial [Lentisphaeria bacterium]|nr:DUF4340 domain-containing protein [Lentisphaeria bacterium]
MKRKQLLSLVLAALVLTVLVVLVRRSRTSTWQSPGGEGGSKVLPDFPVNDVAAVEITGNDGTVRLHRREGTWAVVQRYDYPANYQTLKEFMVDLVDLKAAQRVKAGPSQYGRLELKDPGEGEGGGTKVVFQDQNGKALETLVLGKEHKKSSGESEPGPMGMMGGGGWPDGRYLLVPSREEVVLVTKTFSSVEDDPSRWVDKEFFKITDPRDVSLAEGDAVLWRASRESKTGDLKLDGEVPEGKEVDSSKLSSVKSAFGWASFTDVADPALAPEETGMAAPKVYTARDFDGFVTTVRIGKETGDSKVYLQAEVAYDGPTERAAEENETPEDKTRKDEEFAKKQKENREKAAATNQRLKGWTYIVSKYTVDSVLKTRGELLKDKPKPKEDEKPAEEKPAAAEEAATPEVLPPAPPAPPAAEAKPVEAKPVEAKPVEAKP